MPHLPGRRNPKPSPETIANEGVGTSISLTYAEAVEASSTVAVIAALMLSFSVALFSDVSQDDIRKHMFKVQFVKDGKYGQFGYDGDWASSTRRQELSFRKWVIDTMRDHQPSFNFKQNFGADVFDIVAVADQSGLGFFGAQANSQMWPYENYDTNVRQLEVAATLLLAGGFPLDVFVARDIYYGNPGVAYTGLHLGTWVNALFTLALGSSIITYFALVSSRAEESKLHYALFWARFKWLSFLPIVWLALGTIFFFWALVELSATRYFSLELSYTTYTGAMLGFLVPMFSAFLLVTQALFIKSVPTWAAYAGGATMVLVGSFVTYLIPAAMVAILWALSFVKFVLSHRHPEDEVEQSAPEAVKKILDSATDPEKVRKSIEAIINERVKDGIKMHLERHLGHTIEAIVNTSVENAVHTHLETATGKGPAVQAHLETATVNKDLAA